MKFLSFLGVFIFLMQISNAIVINEIMADPIADETLNEWVELYNEEDNDVNVSGWIIGDDNDNDTILGGLYNNEGTIIPAFGYAIITDDATRVYNNFNVSSDAVRLYVDDASIGNGLSNDGETIYLYDNSNKLMDKKTYNETTEDLSWAYINNTLYKSNPTPGFANDESLLSGCDYAVEFILAKTVFDNSSEFSFKIRASKVSGIPTNFTARAKIEDLNGKLIREYAPFTNESITKQKTSTGYTPNLEEGKSYFMDSNITAECSDTNLGNNFDTRIITIKGKPLQEESSISIENILDIGSDKKAKFGQTVRVRLRVYKGNTNKKSVALWIESDKGRKLSKQSSANLEDKYTPYSITIPVQIMPNCDNEFKDDDYTLKVEGLDTEDEKGIEIQDLTDSLCEVKVVQQKELSPNKFDFEIKEFNENVQLGERFNTKIELDNNNNVDIPIKIWSYVYRGSKSYSGDREENKKEFTLKANSLQEIELENIVDDAESGSYKFKVVINKNNQKTNNEIIKDITINNMNNNIETSKNENLDLKNNPDNKNDAESLVTANKVLMPRELAYESATEKAKNLAPIFLIILSVLLNIVLIWRR
ncbi:lamin tail domain-containing protein [Candidatus Woesearchaeota archaeon]|nr:lamin tail domain-containing protein [Candidatus Woesearchaeota archaeon]